jgi:hypothetical protein
MLSSRKTLVKRAGVVAVTVLVATMTARAAINSGQVIFSTPGFLMTLSDDSTTPFGFWIWCIADAAENGGGPYQIDHACQGSMYFYALDHNATHVIGGSSEGEEGIYTMNVWEGRLPELLNGSIFTEADYHCTLTNTTEGGKGLGTDVQVDCTFKSGLTGSALVTNAVVNVTGPPED